VGGVGDFGSKGAVFPPVPPEGDAGDAVGGDHPGGSNAIPARSSAMVVSGHTPGHQDGAVFGGGQEK
jgi:hypothetical protein